MSNSRVCRNHKQKHLFHKWRRSWLHLMTISDTAKHSSHIFHFHYCEPITQRKFTLLTAGNFMKLETVECSARFQVASYCISEPLIKWSDYKWCCQPLTLLTTEPNQSAFICACLDVQMVPIPLTSWVQQWNLSGVSACHILRERSIKLMSPQTQQRA